MTKWLKDTIERVAATFAEVFITAMLVSVPTDWNISTARAAALAGLAAAAAVLKAAIAAKVPSSVSPASLAPAAKSGV